jgi:hypothetical protein
MSFYPRPVSPAAAWADLRAALKSGSGPKLLFGIAAVAVPLFFMLMFFLSTKEEVYRPPTIIYVENWKVGRTTAEIKAQQKIDTAKRKVLEAELEARKAKMRAYFQDLEKKSKAVGL